MSCAPATATERLFAGANVGFGPDADRLGVHADFPLLDRPLREGRRWTVSIEGGISYWDSSRPGPHQRAWQLSGVPFVRLHNRRGLYVELGIGASVFTERTLGTQELGSSFQFCDHLGAGVEWDGARHRLGLRLSHFSNGRIADPNDGLDLWQIAYTRRF
ncbi:MAG TPA: acyloxyacyl hydrolase [Lysobacter sp.]